ncbi:hypothetical protein ACFL2J_08120 [Candidatus Omnitrophota bacterium]
MKQISKESKKAVTLVELIVSIFLLSVILLTAVSIEVSMRKMQTTPTARIKLLNELIPVVKKMKNVYGMHLGSGFNPSVEILDGGSRLRIRIDNSGPHGQVDPGDIWEEFRWNGTEGDPLEHILNSTWQGGMAEGVTDFLVTAPTGNANEAITIDIRKKLFPGEQEDWFDNPAFNLTTTIYSRGASLN